MKRYECLKKTIGKIHHRDASPQTLPTPIFIRAKRGLTNSPILEMILEKENFIMSMGCA